MISKGWKQLKAREVFDSVSKKNHPDEELLSATQDIGVVPRSMLSARVTMPTKNIETFKLVEKGDFVISLRSFQGGIEYSQYRGIVSPAYTVLKNKVEICSEFFKYYFKTSKFINNLDSSVIGIRDGKQISYKDFAEIYLPYPPLPEQKKIAAILSSVDDTIQTTQAVIDQTLRVKQGLLQQLLTRGIGHTKFKKTELGEIPKEWEVVKIEELCKEIFVGIATSTTNYYTDETGVPIIRNQNIKENQIDGTNLLYITSELAEKNKTRALREKDIISVRTGYPGLSAVVNKDYENCHTFTTLISRPYEHVVDSYYLCFFINSSLGRKAIEENLVGSAQQNLNVSSLKNVKVIVPNTITEQQKIAFILSKVDYQIQDNQNYLTKLQELKKGLMQDLLTGFVRVKLGKEVAV